MFERFNEAGRAVVVRSQDAAHRHRATQIETTHLVESLLRNDQTLGAALLRRLGVDIVAARDQCGAHDPPLPPPTTHIPFTRPVKEVFEAGARAADGLGHAHIGPEHLVLGLVTVPNRGADWLFRNSVPSTGAVEHELRSLIGSHPYPDPHGEAPHPDNPWAAEWAGQVASLVARARRSGDLVSARRFVSVYRTFATAARSTPHQQVLATALACEVRAADWTDEGFPAAAVEAERHLRELPGWEANVGLTLERGAWHVARGELTEAERAIADGLAVAGGGDRIRLLAQRAEIVALRGDQPLARRQLVGLLHEVRVMGDRASEHALLGYAMAIELFAGDVPAAAQAAALARAAQPHATSLWSDLCFARIAALQGDRAAHDDIDTCIRRADAGEHHELAADARLGAAAAAYQAGDLDRARRVGEDGLAIAEANHLRITQTELEHGLGVVAHARGDIEEARRHYGVARALATDIGLHARRAHAEQALASLP